MGSLLQNRAINCRNGLLLLAILAATASHASPPVSPFSLDYRLKSEGIPFSITAHRTLEPVQDGLWKMEVHASNWLGEIRETALFNWQGCTPQSNYYSYLRRGLGRVKEAHLRLDRDAGIAASERTDKPIRNYTITDDATDELSVTLALQCELRNGKKNIHLNVADEREQESQHFRVVGEETLKVGRQRVKTVKVQRQRGPNSERQTYLWFAPGHDYLLIQLLQENSDGEHVMTLQSMKEH